MVISDSDDYLKFTTYWTKSFFIANTMSMAITLGAESLYWTFNFNFVIVLTSLHFKTNLR